MSLGARLLPAVRAAGFERLIVGADADDLDHLAAISRAVGDVTEKVVIDADVLPAWVAEMDFPLAEPVKAALHAAVDNDDAGYLGPSHRGVDVVDHEIEVNRCPVPRIVAALGCC